MISTTGYSGHMGKGTVVASEGGAPLLWEVVTAESFLEVCYWKYACAK